MYTVEDVKKWIVENNVELEKDRLNCQDETVKMLNRILPDKSKTLWDIGCWIEDVLEKLGADKEEISDAQFAFGQRAFGGAGEATAVAYVNEFVETKEIAEKPGPELAEKINNEILGR